jgi:hypothetical protein
MRKEVVRGAPIVGMKKENIEVLEVIPARGLARAIS